MLHKKGFNIIKWLFLIVANGILSAIPFYFIISPAFFIGAVPNLLVATVINAVISMLAMPIIAKVFNERKVSNV